MAGKDYNKAVRAHKLTFQALWQIVMSELLLLFIQEHDRELFDTITLLKDGKHTGDLIATITEER